MLIAADALVDLCRAAGDEAVSDFGRRLGTALGRRLAERLGDGASSASMEVVLDHLGGELAVMGLGSLGLERWGRALVLTIDGCPLGASGDRLVGAVLEGALEAMTAREVAIESLERDEQRARMLVASPAAAAKARAWLIGGLGWPDVLAKLHAASARTAMGESS